MRLLPIPAGPTTRDDAAVAFDRTGPDMASTADYLPTDDRPRRDSDRRCRF